MKTYTLKLTIQQSETLLANVMHGLANARINLEKSPTDEFYRLQVERLESVKNELERMKADKEFWEEHDREKDE
jgi:hypothetical protein